MVAKRSAGRVFLLLGFVFGAAMLASASQSSAAGPDPSVTTLTSNRAPAYVGQQITFTARVDAQNSTTLHPTGSVTFYDGATPIGSGNIGTSTHTAKINAVLS